MIRRTGTRSPVQLSRSARRTPAATETTTRSIRAPDSSSSTPWISLGLTQRKTYSPAAAAS